MTATHASTDAHVVPALSTASVLLETSAGALTIDLFGADCPSLSGGFANLCRCKYWNGCTAVEVVPDVAVFFSHAADTRYAAAVDDAVRRAAQSWPRARCATMWHLLDERDAAARLRRRCATTATGATADAAAWLREQAERADAAARREGVVAKQRISTCIAAQPQSERGGGGGGGDGAAAARVRVRYRATPRDHAAGSLCHAGLLFVDVADEVVAEGKDSEAAAAAAAAVCAHPTRRLRFGLTLTSRHVDDLDAHCVAIGQVREGWRVLARLRAAVASLTTTTPSRNTAAATVWPRPVRIVRVLHATVLPTMGTSCYADVTRAGACGGGGCAQQHDAAVTAALHSAGCFAYWAPTRVVAAANRRLCELVTHATATLCRGGTTDTHRSDDAVSCARSACASNALLVRLPTTAAAATSRTPPPPQQQHPGDDSDDDEAGDAAAMVSIEYNPHATGPYLSSDDDDDDDGDSDGDTRSRVRTQRAVHEAARAMHAAKASESLQLMLNVLNEVADVDGSVRPADNVLFVCKLNPATTSAGLRTCFAQVAHVRSCDVMRDKQTGQSLCYAFVELDTAQACYDAVQTMHHALVDDCRIHVDYSQSVSRLWAQRQRELRKRARLH